ncbi:nuclear hormone receptor HR96 isoform X2 [Xylocopa sonorina]|uniref:nuclear hormone receptor HR96 isoform X2 n=1 Tax=Xylocopa sonorina TaxID=1818115 RepID=UPI00403B23CF
MEDEQLGREANKICGVCGDRALGYNFNAVSCESCKAFFRRNALKNKDFRCPFTENCNITPVTRRFCQKCRLDKCFVIGMRKEHIMSEEDKVLKRQKIEENRAKKRPTYEGTRPSKMKKDANRQSVTDSLSPVTAASVPSPSSPPENGTISGSKTLDMMKDSSHNSNSNFESYEHSSPLHEDNEADTERMRRDSNSPLHHQQRFDKVKSVHNMDKDKKIVISSRKFEQNILSLSPEFVSVNGEPVNYSPEFENTSCYSKFDCSPVQNTQYIDHATHYRKTDIDVNTGMHMNMQMTSEEPVANQKQNKESCLREDDLVANKLPQDATPIMKLVNNTNFVAKIFQNEELLMKIMSDPAVISKLEADPQISQLFKETGVIVEKDTPPEKEVNTNRTFKPVFKVKEKQIENPILTDLITNSNQEDCIKQRDEPSSSSDWNRNIVDVTRDVIQDVRRVPIAADSIESILCEAIKLEFSAYSALGGMETRRVLNDAERAKLNELIVANKALLAPLDEDITNLIGEDCKFKNNFGRSDPALLDVINLTAIAIRRLIKMAKKINAFKNMCQEDQIALLKGGCTEMMILRSALNYDIEKDIWWIPHSQESMSNIKVDVLKEAKGNLYAEHARFIRSFDPRWRDENIILILSAIALFTPNRPKVVHNDVIKLEQNSYYYLLRRYLESVYPGCEAKSMFLKLIQKISDLHRLNNEVVGVYLNLNPSRVEPLLIEIFDLKH